MRVIRGGSGLGDSIYTHVIARHYVKLEEEVKILSDFPELHQFLNCKVEPFSRLGADTVSHYSLRKQITSTNQFEDCCIQARVNPKSKVEYKLEWVPDDKILDKLNDKIKRPFLCVSSYRAPMARTDGYGAELSPDFDKYQNIVNALSEKYDIVLIGQGHQLRYVTNVNISLVGKTSITDLVNLVYYSAGVFAPCSFLIPLSESLDKKGLFLWSKLGMNSVHNFIRAITPEKVLSKPSSMSLIDNNKDYRRVVDDFCNR